MSNQNVETKAISIGIKNSFGVRDTTPKSSFSECRLRIKSKSKIDSDIITGIKMFFLLIV